MSKNTTWVTNENGEYAKHHAMHAIRPRAVVLGYTHRRTDSVRCWCGDPCGDFLAFAAVVMAAAMHMDMQLIRYNIIHVSYNI